MPKTILVCSKCNARNYKTGRDSKVKEKALELNKFCPFCNAKTKHKETI